MYRSPPTLIAAAAATSLALAANAAAQDSTAPAAPVQTGDALPAYAPAAQVADFVVDLTPIAGSWGGRYALAPLLKTSRTTAASGPHLNHVPATAAASPLLAAGPIPRPTYLAWAVPGQGVNGDINLPPTDNGTGQYGALDVAGLRAGRFGAAMLEFGPGPDGAFATGDDENNIIAATAALLTRRVNRLYVSRTVALTNKPAPGLAGANTATASLGLGAVDEDAAVHLLADAHGLLAPGRLLGKRFARVESSARNPAVVNHLQQSGAADAAATAVIPTAPGAIPSTPSMIPSSVAARPVLIAGDLASNHLHEAAPGSLSASTAHLPEGGHARGGLAFSPQGFPPLAPGGGSGAGVAAILARTDDNTKTRGIALFGLDADGAPAGRLLLTLPTDALADPVDGFAPAAYFPTLADHQFTAYAGQSTFRGGNGQVALAVLPDGDLLAAAVVAPTGHPGAVPPSPDNYIAVARIDAATLDAAWTIAAHTGDATGASGNASKAIRQDADGDGHLDPSPIGRLALHTELPFPAAGPSISAPAMDRDGNIYFIAAVRLDLAPAPTFTTALLRANYNPAAGGGGGVGGAGGYELELLAHAGSIVRGGNSATDYRIERLALADADSADSGSIWSGAIVTGRLPLVPAGALPYGSPMSLGALAFTARILYDADNNGAFLDPALPGNESSADQPYASLMVLMPHIQPGDANRDGAVNSNDISAFLTRWLADLAAGTLQADWSADGITNSNDISAFLTDWLASL